MLLCNRAADSMPLAFAGERGGGGRGWKKAISERGVLWQVFYYVLFRFILQPKGAGRAWTFCTVHGSLMVRFLLLSRLLTRSKGRENKDLRALFCGLVATGRRKFPAAGRDRQQASSR